MSSVVSLKFIIIGPSGVGKTSILKRLIDDKYSDDSTSTIGVEFDSIVMNIDRKQVKLQIWDTAGQDRFRSIARAYFRNAVGVLLVYDITVRKTFDELNYWLNDVRALCDRNVVTLLVGNKCDLSDSRTITISEAKAFAQINQLDYLETSAKGGDNIRESFSRTASMILSKGLHHDFDNSFKSPTPAPTSNVKNKKKCCS
uniref:Small GTP-binding protein n=1 Tax=Coptotermes formosanus TaxID=36987 RepID=R4V4P2_COPFO|nr:small GTP-binding protein [Coptotermes formosanus]